MGSKRVWTLCWGFMGIALAMSLVLGQQPPGGKASRPPSNPGPLASGRPPAKRDLAKFSLLDRQVYLAGQRGTEWLQRANRPDGRFVSGYLPDLRSPMEGDHYLQQVEGALALARAARYYQDAKAAALARQALLTLLLETMVDPKTPDVRHTTMPSTLINRLAAGGLLVAAIQELPEPGKDLIDQARQLNNYLFQRRRADGSLSFLDPEVEGKAGIDPGGISHYTGPALYALVRGGQSTGKPDLARLDVVRKAAGYYTRWWTEHKNLTMVPWHTAAYTEAYLATKEQPFADAVFAMNDWVCDLQYQQLDSRRPLWRGGFKNWRDGREVAEAPEAGSAALAESLVQAGRLARHLGDVRRWRRYQEAVEACFQFLTTLQYTDANTQHFASWYRPALVGAFHASHQDGNLRLDYTSHAVSALVLYLENGAGTTR